MKERKKMNKKERKRLKKKKDEMLKTWDRNKEKSLENKISEKKT